MLIIFTLLYQNFRKIKIRGLTVIFSKVYNYFRKLKVTFNKFFKEVLSMLIKTSTWKSLSTREKTIMLLGASMFHKVIR